ncbi:MULTISPECIES: hypothetical protein [Candidatus Nitrosocaldus]|jgi:hypothetical protein|uniref:Uncharacterized protein n=1 Tax=Candidatus Nitrosocaldus cavascurensis TaxID=2058097 RepID=A0A2K5AQX9_9ARCH|nr:MULTISPECIES: hypothetical protein [Candidatus Nitrosocaldus]SPC34058.1 exported protein of unknown function [Candidatus Nitrosocaldus cavascurensis]
MKKDAIVTTTIIMVIASTLLVGGGLQGANAEPDGEPPCITFTFNKKKVGEDCESKATDLHLFFIGNGTLQFTRDGKKIGESKPSPPGSNGFNTQWKGGVIDKFEWTRDGGKIGDGRFESIPRDGKNRPANDLEFSTTGLIIGCFWTKDGKFLRYCVLPERLANDFHFVVPESSIGIIAMIATPLAVLGYWRMRRIIH